MASIGGDLLEDEKKTANEIVKSFGEKVRAYALALQVPASQLKVQQCTFLFVAEIRGHRNKGSHLDILLFLITFLLLSPYSRLNNAL
jgi:hypothetical protein